MRCIYQRRQGLFVFHLMTVCVLLTTVSRGNKQSEETVFVIIVSQYCVAVFPDCVVSWIGSLFAGSVPDSNQMGKSGLHRSSMLGSLAGYDIVA